MAEQKATGYISSDDKTNKTLAKYDAVKNFASITHAATITTRHGYDPNDYYSQRPQDAMPSKFRDVINACRSVYLRVNVVRNVIDLMTDFACENIKVIHPDKKVEAFFKVWMEKAEVQDAVDEFVRHFLVDGNVVVRRRKAKISEPVENQWTEKSMAKKEVTPEPEKLYVEKKTNKREIPIGYVFLNIAALYWVGGELAKLSGKRQLAFRPAPEVVQAINNPSDPFQKSIVDRIPAQIAQKFGSRDPMLELDMDTVYVSHNKKDSWEDWAPPFLYSVLADIHFKDKLRQAEISALDGVINVIRLWKIGAHEAGVFPTSTSMAKLAEILENNTGGGATDIIWDSMIDMKDYYPPIDKILGAEKYQQVNRDILIGLGVPEVLIGGQGSNFSNSWIQLKTLIEKLKYIRGKVQRWLEGEAAIVCEAMDIKILPKIRFPQNNLEDENISRKLIVGLLDRGVISVEAVLESYGEDFLIEVERMRNEKKEKVLDVKSPLDPKPVAKGQPGQGRPSQTQDVGRKTRTAKPRRSSASKELTLKALEAIDLIEECVIPLYMDNLGVKNARKLTNSQKQEISDLRNLALSSIKPDTVLDNNIILEMAESYDKLYNKDVLEHMMREVKGFTAKNGKSPTLSQTKRIVAIAWSEFHSRQ